MRYQCQFKGSNCELWKVGGKSPRDHSCYWKRKRCNLFMKLLGKNNMGKLARLNAYGKEKSKCDF